MSCAAELFIGQQPSGYPRVFLGSFARSYQPRTMHCIVRERGETLNNKELHMYAHVWSLNLVFPMSIQPPLWATQTGVSGRAGQSMCVENEALIFLDLTQGSLITTANLFYLQLRFSNQLMTAGCNRQNTSSWKHGFMLPMLPHSMNMGHAACPQWSTPIEPIGFGSRDHEFTACMYSATYGYGTVVPLFFSS